MIQISSRSLNIVNKDQKPSFLASLLAHLPQYRENMGRKRSMGNFFITLDIQNFFFWKCDIIYFYLDLNNKIVLLYRLCWSEGLCFAFLLWFSCIYILMSSSATGLYLKIKFSERQLELCEGLGRGLLLHQGKAVGVSSTRSLIIGTSKLGSSAFRTIK